MTRWWRALALGVTLGVLTGCGSLPGASDSAGAGHAKITVTYAESGATHAVTAEYSGLTCKPDQASGRTFAMAVNAGQQTLQANFGPQLDFLLLGLGDQLTFDAKSSVPLSAGSFSGLKGWVIRMTDGQADVIDQAAEVSGTLTCPA